MTGNPNYHLGLLYLVHLLISSDGIIDESEKAALAAIKTKENIPDDQYKQFQQSVAAEKERDIYQKGIELLNLCSDEEKLNAFVHLYKMSEADGRVHVKEVRLLLYSIRLTGIEFDDVVKKAQQVG